MSRRVIVTDHAIMRYLERVGGFEIDRLRRQIADRLAPFVIDGASSVVIDGHTFVLDRCPDGVILVTVLPKGSTNRCLPNGRWRD